MWGIIGGSGFESFQDVELIEELDEKTPFGPVSSGYRKIRVAGEECLFISRHGKHHQLLPSEVNYRANLFALKRDGASKVLAIASVGSLQKEIKPNHLVLPSQFLNLTKRGLGTTTFAGNGVVGHVALGQPVWEEGSRYAASLQEKLGITVHSNRTYVCVEGPGFSTRVESKLYRQMGGHVIGMTGFPEYALAREAGLCYLPCSFVTDNDSWDESVSHVTMEQILSVMKSNSQKAYSLMKLLVTSSLRADPSLLHGNLKEALFCSYDNLSSEQKGWLDILGKGVETAALIS